MSFKEKPYPLTIVSDRYRGVYSGGTYLAFNMETYEVANLPIADGDPECWEFWKTEGKHIVVGKGNTPEEALENLIQVLDKEE